MTWLHTGDVYPAWDTIEAHMEAFGRIKVPWTKTSKRYAYRPKYPLYSQIVWVGDDLDFKFEDPKDWPELDAATVEDYNALHRAAHNHRIAVANEFHHEFFLMHEKDELAFAQMEVVRQVRFNKLFGYRVTGGYIVGYVHKDHFSDSFVDDAERLLIERHNAKKEKDWSKADEIRDQLKRWGYEIRDEKEGTWFIFER